MSNRLPQKVISVSLQNPLLYLIVHHFLV
ncbi:hypothetical protein Pint_20214 [Pistacia integerrima]|uniref:Uncharacterized protein n=1 Tax=Pistacia integerrima TaxID=434235 RepID=A0ACC0XCT4_9ROSI|nr:hypothetical protein Pint_20214 [Pistacia integerrima]